MCKKLICLTSFVLMLGSVSNAEDIQWIGGGADNLWSTPGNWNLGRVPTLADEVLIDVPAAAAPNGPVIQDGIDAKAKGIFTEAPGEPTLTMTGGTLEVAEWIWYGDGADSFGIWDMSGGTVTVAEEFELGWDGGAGTLNMTGGTINAGEAVIPTGSGAFGELFLYGGTYNVTKPGGLEVNENGLIDITEGTLVLEGDDTVKVNGLIAAGQITAYGSSGQFELDFDVSNPGKTTLTSVAPAPPELLVTIPVPNAGFEDPVLAEDDWTWLDVPGWTWVGGEGPGIWHVTSADFDPVVAPEGQNVLYTENAVGDGGGVAQVLTETFAANTDYTLTVEVGNSNYYYFSGYSVQLLAGGAVIAEDNDTLWPDYKNWATSTVQYTYDSADSALVGQHLEIRLLTLALDKDNPSGNTVGVEFDNVTLSYVAGAEPGVTITVDLDGDIAAANELAMPGDTIEIAEGTYILTSQIEIKDGVTYQGAGPGLTIIDGNNVTRAFVAWGDRGATNGQVDENGDGVPNLTGPTGWVLDGLTIQNCVSDAENRQNILGAARDLLNNYTGTPYTLATAQDENGGVEDNPEWFDILSGSADDDLTDEELQAYLDANPVGSDGHLVVNDDKRDDGGAVCILNGADGTIRNCAFSNNTAVDDGGAIIVDGDALVVAIEDCTFNLNTCGDQGGAIKLSGAESNSTLTGCSFTENSAPEDDAGAIIMDGAGSTGSVYTVTDCTFTGCSAKDDGGAIYATADRSTYVWTNCTFIGNYVTDSGADGGAVRYAPDRADMTVTNCSFIGNGKDPNGTPVGDDGGAWQTGDDDCGPMTFMNCLFADNASKDDRILEVKGGSAILNCTFIGNVAGDEALIAVRGQAWDSTGDEEDDVTTDDSIISNCLFINNTLLSNKQVIGDTRNDVFAPTVTNCLFFGNLDQNDEPAENTDDNSVEVGTIDVSTVTDAAQIVVDPAGDYHIAAGSPAIDASDPATATDADIEGTAAVGVRDVGAYESAN